MSWSFSTETRPVARKDYKCQAAEWIFRSDCGLEDFADEDRETIKLAKVLGYKILAGDPYVCVKGMWDGEWCIFRAREDLDLICKKYNLYEEY